MVYLKNGSVIRGVIIEQIPNVSIKIETADRNIFVYKMEEIEKITKERIPEQFRNNKKPVNQGRGLSAGYRGIIDIGYDIGVGDYGIDRIKLNIINGYQFNPHFSVGFGTGLRYFHEVAALYIPLFLDLRANILNENVSPYVAIRTGYSMRVTNSIGGGFMLNPTVGVTFKTSSKSSMNIGFGYDLLRLNGFGFSALSFNLGVSF